MHIHPPKPLHGWKEFANEIFVIVIGVLIALGFEQVVEQWHWHHEIVDARETLHNEVARNLLVMQFDYDNSACRDANLGELQRRIKANDPASVQAFLALWPKLRGKSIFVDSTNWNLVNSSGLLAHMSPHEKQALAAAYATFEIETRYIRIRGDLMNEILGKASTFEGSASSRESLLEQIAIVRRIYLRAENFPDQIAGFRQKTGIQPASTEEVQRELGIGLSPCARFDQIAKTS